MESWRVECIQPEHQFGCETGQGGIQAEAEHIPRVADAGDQGDGGHGPVVAQGRGHHQQLEVEHREVEEGQQPGHEAGAVRGWVVRLGEAGEAAAQEGRPQAEQDHGAEGQPDHAPPPLLGFPPDVTQIQGEADSQHGDPLLLGEHGQGGQQGRHQTPAPGPVTQDGQETQEAGQDVRPAHHPGHSLRVDRGHGPGQAGHQRGRAGQPGQGGDQPHEGEAHQAVQEDVGQVEAPGAGAGHQVVEAEGEAGQGAVTLVGAGVAQRDAPVVRGEQGARPRPRDQGVVQDGRPETRLA